MENGLNFPDPSRDQERPVGDLDQQSYTNWMRLPEDIRRSIVDHVKNKADITMLNRWRDQHARGMRIGSDDIFFHMCLGMQIRNACRDILTDDGLPPVKYDDGNEYQNWDDFYFGMLQQLASETHE